MFSHNKTGYILGIHLADIRQHLVKSGRIQQSSCSEYLIHGITEFMLRYVSQNIHRIGYIDQNRISGIRHDLLHSLPHHFHIGLQKYHTVSGITRLNTRSGCIDNNLCIFTLFKASNPDIRIRTVGKSSGMAGIQYYTQCLLLIPVDHHNLIGQIHAKNGIQYGRSHMTGSNQYNFSII